VKRADLIDQFTTYYAKEPLIQVTEGIPEGLHHNIFSCSLFVF
jgi:hypothetical protein